MFRKATMADAAAITAIYEELHTAEEEGRARIGWVRGVYPVRKTAEDAIARDEMFVEEIDGQIVAAARINQVQESAYGHAPWKHPAPEEEVMVLHTLVVSPGRKGSGLGTKFVAFYEQYALDHGCKYLRMDTNEKNQAARSLYRKLGYTEVGVVPTVFNGIEGVQLVCLEKKL